MNETIELVAKVFMMWNLEYIGGKITKDPEYEKRSFICKMLRKKMEIFNIDIDLPDYLIMIIELCAGGNPGVSQLMLREILSKTPYFDKSKGIVPSMVSATYPDSFPVLKSPKWNEYFNKQWDAQKDENGNNKCDTPEWWMEVIKWK